MQNNYPDQRSDLDEVQTDTRTEFEAWLDRLRPRETIKRSPTQSPSLDQLQPDFIVFCSAGDCRISFDGVLHLEGFVSATIRSESGTLVTGGGLIDGNVEVATAHIDGSLIGNIHASDRVVLYSEARVAGNIVTCGLSTKPGALFEGDCIPHESPERRMIPFDREPTSEFLDQT